MYVTTFIGSIVASMEEMNAKQDDFDPTSISTMKVALMGPLAGIRDSLFFGTIKLLQLVLVHL